MTSMVVSRRRLLEAGACAVAGTAGLLGATSAHALIGLSTSKEEVIHRYYAAWEKKDWGLFDVLLADNFTFTSANNDDHISKSVFKTRCWETQIDFIKRFELERVIGNGNEAFDTREKLFASIRKQLPNNMSGVVRPPQEADLYETVSTRVFQDYSDTDSTRFRLLSKN